MLKSYPGFELREYEPHTLVTTWSRAMHGAWHWEPGLGGRGTTLVAELRAVELTA